MSPVSTRICVPNLVAVRRSCRKKKGGYRQTDRQRKLQLYIVDVTKATILLASSSPSSYSHFYVGSMYDDIHLHARTLHQPTFVVNHLYKFARVSSKIWKNCDRSMYIL